MLRYAITDRRMFAGDERDRRNSLLVQARQLAAAGVDYLQLREKDLPREDLVGLARTLRTELHARHAPTRLLLNCGDLIRLPADPGTRAGTARRARAGSTAGRPPTFGEATAALLADTGVAGLHLPGGWSPAHIALLRGQHQHTRSGALWISIAAHTVEECRTAAGAGADLILFSPVFAKVVVDRDLRQGGTGLELLAGAAAAAGATPVLALGGITPENTAACLHTGAAGVAGIRLFLPGRPPPGTAAPAR